MVRDSGHQKRFVDILFYPHKIQGSKLAVKQYFRGKNRASDAKYTGSPVIKKA